MVGYGASTAMADLTITGGSCTRNINWAGFLLGFALGGFFDGILLHQILQWHHLLSGLQGERFVDIRVQILADGGFHALMYVLAIVGLWLLWKTRRQCTEPGAGRALLAMAMIGFGVWHVADSIISHWLMGIHRIRMDSSNPLMWDLIWLFAFGVVPLLVGLWLKRKPSGGAPSRGTIAAAVLAFCSLAGGGSRCAAVAQCVASDGAFSSRDDGESSGRCRRRGRRPNHLVGCIRRALGLRFRRRVAQPYTLPARCLVYRKLVVSRRVPGRV